MSNGTTEKLPREDRIELILTLNNLQLLQDSILLLENEINSIIKSEKKYLEILEIITTINSTNNFRNATN